MQVTAVITTYKRSVAMVERALLSVINQTYRPIEVIVVDDSPMDYAERGAVGDMVKKYADAGVIYVETEGNLGACAARNIGLSMAKGEYIAFLDDDDEWLPEKIEKQTALFISDDIALVYCGSYTVYDDSGKSIERKMKRHKGFVHDELMLKNFIARISPDVLR